MDNLVKRNTGRVIWITGLSGAGKTTLAKALLPLLPQPAILLDGDEMREALALVAEGYDYESRKRLARTYSRLCLLIASQGVTVVCATISLFHDVHDWNRANLPGYFEVFLDIEESQLLARDYKSVYQADTAVKENPLVVGRELLPEYPLSPDITIQNHYWKPDEIATRVYNYLSVEKP